MNYDFPSGQGRFFVLRRVAKQKKRPRKEAARRFYKSLI